MATTKETIIPIRVEGQDAVTTLKDLRNAIKDNRDALVALGNVEDDDIDKKEKQNDIIKKLQDNTKLLNNVMKAGKIDTKPVDLATGSYDELNAELRELRKTYHAMSAMERDSKFGEETITRMNELDAKLKELDANVGQHQRNVGNYTDSIVDAFGILKKEIKDLKGKLLTLDEGTEEYIKTMDELAEKTFALRDMNEKSRYAVADFGEQLANVTGIASGVASGFSAVQGAMALAGVESQDFEKVMVKVQATMAIAQGLQGLEGLIDRVGGLKIALRGCISSVKAFTASIGKAGLVGIVVTAVASITALAVALANTNREYKELEAEIKRINDLQRANSEDIEENIKRIQDSADIARAEGMSEEEVLTRLHTAYKKLWEWQVSHPEGITQETLDTTFRLMQETQHEIDVLQKRAERQRDEEEKNRIAQRQQELEDAKKTELQLLTEKYEEERALYKKHGQDMTLLDQRFQADRMRILTEQSNVEISTESATALQGVAITQSAGLAKRSSVQETEEAVTETRKKSAEDWQAIESTASGAVGTIFDTIANIYENGNKADEKSKKKAKVLRIAEATINMIQGAVGAFSNAFSSLPPFVAPLVGGANAGAVVASGMANIAKIKAVNVGSASVGSGMPSFTPSSIPAPSVPEELPVTRSLTGAKMEDAINRLATQPMKAYVVESELQASNARSLAQNAETTF